MNKKRIFALLMAMIMVVGLVACKSENAEETGVVENETLESVEATEEAVPVVDTLGWKVNPVELENVLPADIQSTFEATGMTYEGMNFKPIVYLAKKDGADRILCHAAEDFEAEDVVYKLYDVIVENKQITDAHEFDMTALMNLSAEDATVAMTTFTDTGWNHCMEQTASEFPTAVRNALAVAPEDVEPIHFMAVHGAEDGTLTFAVLGHKAEEMVMMFIAVPAGGAGELVNVAPIA